MHSGEALTNSIFERLNKLFGKRRRKQDLMRG